MTVTLVRALATCGLFPPRRALGARLRGTRRHADLLQQLRLASQGHAGDLREAGLFTQPSVYHRTNFGKTSAAKVSSVSTSFL